MHPVSLLTIFPGINYQNRQPYGGNQFTIKDYYLANGVAKTQNRALYCYLLVQINKTAIRLG